MSLTVQFAYVLYDFNTQENGEISLHEGEYVQVLNKVNADWYRGHYNGESGNFPCSFVQLLPLFHLKKEQRVFLATDDFPELQAGDLPLTRGDVFIGTEQLNADWWRGVRGSQEGVFPTTHATELPYISQTYENSSHTGITSHNKTHHAERCEVKALVDSEAQIDGELSFTAGDIIQVTQQLDDDWLMGSCNGNIGMFLKDLTETVGTSTSGTLSSNKLVEYTTTNLSGTTSLAHMNTTAQRNLENVAQKQHSTLGENVMPKAEVLYDFTAQAPNELSLKTGEIISILRVIDSDWTEGRNGNRNGMFPSTFVKQIEAVDNTLVEASVLYDFKAVAKEEITLYEGEKVRIIKRLDSDWTEVKTSAQTKGICPSSFLSEVCVNDDSFDDGNIPKTDINKSAPVQMRLSDGQGKSRSASVISNSSLDDLVSIEMAKIKADAAKRLSFQPVKPERPVQPKKNSLLNYNIVPSQSITDPNSKSSYEELRQPFTSQFDWRDEHVSPVITLPSGPEPPKSPASPQVKSPPPVRPTLPPTKSSDNLDKVAKVKHLPPKPSVPPKPMVGDHWIIKNADESDNKESSNTHIETGSLPEAGNTGNSQLSEKVTESAPLQSVHTDSILSKRVVPSRPAPPPPQDTNQQRSMQTTSRTVVPSRPAPSPPKRSSNVFHADYNDDVVKDLNLKIFQLESDIQRYNEEVENLDGLAENAGNIDEQLEFYMENINGMTHEVHELKETLFRMLEQQHAAAAVSQQDKQMLKDKTKKTSLERIDKMKIQRSRIIQEIIDTEEAFLRDLQICLQVFCSSSSPKPPDEVDRETLFGNMAEIVHVSQKFVTSFENSVSNLEFQDQIVGRPFVELGEAMKTAYAPYCRNHDDVCALLEQYKGNEAIQQYIAKGVDEMRKHTSVFTLGAILIKPVQRILKYPLLLGELYKATEDSHPDKTALKQAQQMQTDIAQAINEYKRRKDLVYKYRKDKEENFSEKMSRISLHSFKKKTNRLSMKLSSTIGLAEQTKDEEFERQNIVFHGMERSLNIYRKNVNAFLQQLQNVVDVHESVTTDMSELFTEHQTQEIRTYLSAQQAIASDIFRTFRTSVESEVITQINNLLALFHSPTKLIQKRQDKLLDYDIWTGKVERARDQDKIESMRQALQLAKNNYQALNAQLLDDLPKFNHLAYLIFKDTVSSFIMAYSKYHSDSVMKLFPLLQTVDAEERFSVEQFMLKHNQAAEQLYNNPILLGESQVKPKRLSVDARQPVVLYKGQSESVKIMLRGKYSSTQLHTVTTTYSSSNPMDISVSQGDLVGVVVKKDPMGNADKWYVDNGVEQGFISSSYLTLESPMPVNQSQIAVDSSIPTNQSQTINSAVIFPSDIAGEQETSMTASTTSPPACNSSTNQLPEDHQHEVWQARYDFTARNPNEISFVEGQSVYVFNKHDEEGNPEWWYIQTSEGFGYAPANYLIS